MTEKLENKSCKHCGQKLGIRHYCPTTGLMYEQSHTPPNKPKSITSKTIDEIWCKYSHCNYPEEGRKLCRETHPCSNLSQALKQIEELSIKCPYCKGTFIYRTKRIQSSLKTKNDPIVPDGNPR